MFSHIAFLFVSSIPLPEPVEGVQDHVCTVEMRVTTKTDDETRESLYRYDAENDDWLFLSVNGNTPSSDDLSAFHESERGPWKNGYETTLSLAKNFDVQFVEMDGVKAIYRAEDLPKKSVVVQGRDISRHTVLEFEVIEDEQGAFIQRQRFYAPRPFRMAMIAKVNEAQIEQLYARLPDGQVVTMSSQFLTDYSAFGDQERVKVTRQFSGHQCVEG